MDTVDKLRICGRGDLWIVFCLLVRAVEDRLNGIGNVNAFRAVAVGQRLDELVLDDALIVEHACRQDDDEVDGGVAEVRVAHERLCVRIVVHARENFLCRLNRDAFDGGEVAVIRDADGDADIDVLRGQTEIGDVRTRDGLVRDDDGAARATRDDGVMSVTRPSSPVPRRM